MGPLPIPLLVQLAGGTLMTGLLAFRFWCDPMAAMRETTHRPEKLPLVMINRYLAISIMQVGIIFYGSVEMVGVFFIAAAVMGFGDSLIYGPAGYPHMNHTMVGILSLVGLAFVLYYLL